MNSPAAGFNRQRFPPSSKEAIRSFLVSVGNTNKAAILSFLAFPESGIRKTKDLIVLSSGLQRRRVNSNKRVEHF